MKLGYNTKGTERLFEDMLNLTLEINKVPVFNYVEIGVAEGDTLAAVARKFSERKGSQSWNAIGVDLRNGAFFNFNKFRDLVQGLSFKIYAMNGSGTDMVITDGKDDVVHIVLLQNDQQKITWPKDCIHFAVIDGCHGAPCVERDFLSLEEAIAPNGIVAFHDAGLEDQDIHFQEHCQMNITVRKALHKLDLCPPFRKGWAFMGMAPGDKSPGNLQANGHSFAFFQKRNFP